MDKINAVKLIYQTKFVSFEKATLYIAYKKYKNNTGENIAE